MTLTWSSTNAYTCSLTGNNQNILTNETTSGTSVQYLTTKTHLVYPTQTTNYQINCFNSSNGQSASGYATVTLGGTGGNNAVNLISNSNRLVTIQVGTYNSNMSCAQVINGSINWGDGQNQEITTGCGATLTHQYSNAGNYNIVVYSNNQQLGNLQVYVQ